MNRLATVLVLLTACAPEGQGLTPPERTDALASDEVSPEVVEEAPTPQPQPGPALKPIAPADPPTVRVFAWGECRYPSIQILGDELFTVHHEFHQGSGYPAFDPIIQRIGPDGTVAQDLRYELSWAQPFEGEALRFPPRRLVQFAGRSPDDLFAIVDYAFRDIDGVRIASRKNGSWTMIRMLGPNAVWGGVWPWADGSTLALVDAWKRNGTYETRLPVIRGSGKGPSLDILRSKPGCKRVSLRAVDVSEQGPVTALAKCDQWWLARWSPDDLDGTLTALGDGIEGGEFELDPDGNGYVSLYGVGLYRLQDGALTKLEGAGTWVKDLAVDANGSVWLLSGGSVFRQNENGWEKESIEKVKTLSGIEGSSPLVVDSMGDLHARTDDGAWHPIALEQPDPKGTRVEVLQAEAAGMGDVWVAGKYSRYTKGRKVQRKFGVLYAGRGDGDATVCR